MDASIALGVDLRSVERAAGRIAVRRQTRGVVPLANGRWYLSIELDALAAGDAMAQEIERKFLVLSEAWREYAHAKSHYRQGYLGGSSTCSVRVRTSGDQAWLSVKSRTVGITRQEYEYEIPAAEAEEILETLAEHPVIEKFRYLLEYRGHIWEIDEFAGENAGLIVAEIELSDPEEPFARPVWVGEEVSHDPRYYNANLIRHPYRSWDKQTPKP